MDEALRVNDQRHDQHAISRRAKMMEFLLGPSAALNLRAAYDLGLRHKGSGKTIVTVLCDSGTRYQSKLLSSDWHREKGIVAQGRSRSSLS